MHPNEVGVESYVFAGMPLHNPPSVIAGRTLLYPKPGGQFDGFEKVHDNLQTQILTVWRTLWFELKRMKNPTRGTGSNQFNRNVEYDPNVTDPHNPRGRWGHPNIWMEGNADTVPPPWEPDNFNVMFQPPLPDLTCTREQLASACIDVQVASPQQVVQWSGKSNLSEPTQPNFIKHLSRDTRSHFITFLPL